jgi:hypothetical protein
MNYGISRRPPISNAEIVETVSRWHDVLSSLALSNCISVQLEAHVIYPRCLDSRPRKAKHFALGLGGL